MPKQILVTGGTGFIGSQLVARLASNGASVRVVDLKPPIQKIPSVEYRTEDICNFDTVKNAILGMDAVVHLAALVSVPECESQITKGFETNFLATVKVLEAMKHEGDTQGKLLKLVFTSSAAVYGSLCQKGTALTEECTTAPDSYYALQKLHSEQLIQLFSNRGDVDAVILRLFNVYGKGQDYKSGYASVIPTFLDRLNKNEDLVLHGGGNQTRDFVWVGDVVDALIKAIELKTIESAPVFNIGAGTGVPIRDLATNLMKVSGRTVALKTTEKRTGDVAYSSSNIDRARKVLSWTPKTSLTEGLSSLLDVSEAA